MEVSTIFKYESGMIEPNIESLKLLANVFNVTLDEFILKEVKDKLFYYRGIKEYINNTEKGYLIDTCLNAQDQYINIIKYYLK